MNFRRLLLLTLALLLPLPTAVNARDYEFDGTITRPVLEHYLSCSITMQDLLTVRVHRERIWTGAFWTTGPRDHGDFLRLGVPTSGVRL